MSVLRAIGVEKVYRTRRIETVALRGVDLTIERGEFTALAGPSGSGKTTLLNLLGALDAPTAGTIHLDGEPLAGRSGSELADLRLHRLGFVFQAYNLVPVLTARENVEFVMELQGVGARERRGRALAVLDEVGLGDMARKRPLEMSGGQQQRVAVARAIVSNPHVVLADEPTANLDSVTAGGLLDLMERLNQERGVTFLFSTHDARVIERARRRIRLEDGRIVGDVLSKAA
jgi:putative ABC transport system ATP-binding protein